MHTSYSALDTFKTCPLKYKYQEIDKIRGPKRVEQVFGTLVHSALKFMFERGPLYPTLDQVLDHYKLGWNESKEKIEWTDEAAKETADKLYFEEGQKMIRAFYKKNSPWNFNAIELESRFIVRLTDEKTGLEHTVGGSLDRLDKDPDADTYEIIDYKTGKKMPSQEQTEENMQLAVYSVALLDKWKTLRPEQIKTTLYFLKHNDKVSATMTAEKIEVAKRNIIAIIREIEERRASGDFPPTPGPLCDYCAYRPMCPMWRHEYKKELPKDVSEGEVADAIKEFFDIKSEEDKHKKRLAELRDTILTYMEKKELLRVFGGGGYITKTITERVSFDADKAKPILEEGGLWQAILEPDEKKILDVLPKLSPELQEKLMALRETKTSVMLKQTKKKTLEEDE